MTLHVAITRVFEVEAPSSIYRRHFFDGAPYVTMAWGDCVAETREHGVDADGALATSVEWDREPDQRFELRVRRRRTGAEAHHTPALLLSAFERPPPVEAGRRHMGVAGVSRGRSRYTRHGYARDGSQWVGWRDQAAAELIGKAQLGAAELEVTGIAGARAQVGRLQQMLRTNGLARHDVERLDTLSLLRDHFAGGITAGGVTVASQARHVEHPRSPRRGPARVAQEAGAWVFEVPVVHARSSAHANGHDEWGSAAEEVPGAGARLAAGQEIRGWLEVAVRFEPTERLHGARGSGSLETFDVNGDGVLDSQEIMEMQRIGHQWRNRQSGTMVCIDGHDRVNHGRTTSVDSTRQPLVEKLPIALSPVDTTAARHGRASPRGQTNQSEQERLLRSRLKALSYRAPRANEEGRQSALALLKHFDRDSSGTLDVREFTALVRKGGKVPRAMLSDEDIAKQFCTLCDTSEWLGDRYGAATISLRKLTDFVWGADAAVAIGDQPRPLALEDAPSAQSGGVEQQRVGKRVQRRRRHLAGGVPEPVVPPIADARRGVRLYDAAGACRAEAANAPALAEHDWREWCVPPPVRGCAQLPLSTAVVPVLCHLARLGSVQSQGSLCH
jgi:hypothetical protein